MTDVATLFLIGWATAFATGLGAIPVFFLGERVAAYTAARGTATALPMQAAGYSHSRQFWAAVLTSVPQPFAAVGAFVLVEHVTALLPASFAFAAGAMLALVACNGAQERETRIPVRRCQASLKGAPLRSRRGAPTGPGRP